MYRLGIKHLNANVARKYLHEYNKNIIQRNVRTHKNGIPMREFHSANPLNSYLAMHSAFITLNGVPTKVSAWGRWIEESFPENGPTDVIILIPGNPGITSSYDDFLKHLHERLGWPVWVVGHAGHERPENESLYNIPETHEHPHLYNLNGQINNKLEFFDKYVPANARVHLLGHSVGAYIITKLLKSPPCNEKVFKSYLLFPTIELIGDTPCGKFFTAVTERVAFFIIFLAWLFSVLPQFILHCIVTTYVTVTGIPKSQIKTIISLLDPVVIKRVFFMAKDEMRTLKERDSDVIKANLGKIRMYFGKHDGWSPRSYYERLKADIPGVHAEIGQHQIDHAFCLRHSKEVAIMVLDWIIQSQ